MKYWIGVAIVLAAALGAALSGVNEYFFYAAFVVLQFVVLATAWNILGGYAGYVNFGTPAFFGIGAYASVVLFKALGAPLIVMILAAALMGGLLGLGVGLLTLRLRGIFFAIATVAVIIIMETLMVNWRYVGGATGLQLLRPEAMAPFASYTRMVFVVMVIMAVFAVSIARYIQTSWIGRGLRAIRDSEEAAECSGVPTLKLKLFACVVSGALMGAAGAPMPMYLSFIEPASTFNLSYTIGALGGSIIGGMSHWLGPIIGAVLLGSLQQIISVTIPGEANVLIVGVLLVLFVVAAPEGILGLFKRLVQSLLQVKNVSKHFGGFTALSEVSIAIAPGERFGLIGPNGSGKTTLINCISGSLRNDGGSIEFDGEEISKLAAYQRTRKGIARSFQIPRPFHSMSVLENLLVPYEYVVHLKEADAERQAMEILRRIGLVDKAQAQANQLSQVELRKLELARAMAARPRLLISDEAMAGLSGSEVDEVLKILFALNAEGITIIMIEHIMQAVMRFSQRVVCLDAGKIICEGTPDSIVANPEVQKAYLGA